MGTVHGGALSGEAAGPGQGEHGVRPDPPALPPVSGEAEGPGQRWALAEAAGLIVALGLSEVVSDELWPSIGLGLHAVLLGVLIWRGSLAADPRQQRFYLAAAVLPLVRILSFSISPQWLTGIWFYVATESLLLVAGLSVAYGLRLSWRAIGLGAPRHGWLALLTIASGVGAGWLESHILHVTPLASGLSLGQVWLPAILLVLFTGFTEEITFRGVLQPVAAGWLGPAVGVAFTALSWGLLHTGWNSPLDVVFVCAVGALWGWARQRDDSVVGTSLAHGVANVMLFLVMPFVR